MCRTQVGSNREGSICPRPVRDERIKEIPVYQLKLPKEFSNYTLLKNSYKYYCKYNLPFSVAFSFK